MNELKSASNMGEVVDPLIVLSLCGDVLAGVGVANAAMLVVAGQSSLVDEPLPRLILADPGGQT